MKRCETLWVMILISWGSIFAAPADFREPTKEWEDLAQNLKIININQLTDHDLKEILEGNYPETAIEFSTKTTLPINFFLKGDIVHLVENIGHSAVEIKQTFYVRYVHEELIFSTQLNEWKSFFEFMTGNASVLLHILDGKPSLTVGAEVNQRS